jgi:hypothetical protein
MKLREVCEEFCKVTDGPSFAHTDSNVASEAPSPWTAAFHSRYPNGRSLFVTMGGREPYFCAKGGRRAASQTYERLSLFSLPDAS